LNVICIGKLPNNVIPLTGGIYKLVEFFPRFIAGFVEGIMAFPLHWPEDIVRVFFRLLVFIVKNF